MMKELEWMTLEQRRLIARLVMMYRIHYGLIDVSSDYTTKSHSLGGHPVTIIHSLRHKTAHKNIQNI